MAVAQEPGLPAVAVGHHPPLDQGHRQALVERVVARAVGAEIDRFLVRPQDEAQDRWQARHAVGDIGSTQDLIDAIHQLLTALEDGLDDRLLFQDLQRRDSGSDADGVPAVGAAVGHAAVPDDPHHLLLPADRGDGEAIAHRLGVGDQVGLYVEVLLRPAVGDAETGLHLIEDEDDAISVAQLPDLLQPAGLGQDASGVAHQRLHEDRRQFVPAGLHRLLQPLQVVEGQVDDVVADVLGDARTGLDVDGAATRTQGTCRRPSRAEQEVVVHSVVLALELDEPLPPRVAPGDAQCVHRRLAAGVGQANLIHTGQPDNLFRHLDLQGRRPGEERAIANRLHHPLHHRWVGVAQDDGTEGQTVVDVLVLVGVPDVGPLAPSDDQRVLVPPVTEVGVDAVGDELFGLLEQGLGLGQIACHITSM